MVYDSKQEKVFFKTFKLKKNTKRITIFDNFLLHNSRPITIIPDFFNKKILLEFKGFHKNYLVYNLKRKFTLDYCFAHGITYYEVKKKINNIYVV